MNKKILELKNISLSFDNKKTYILKDMSFSVYKWEVLSVIWINWAWKSSLLKIIAWIYKKTSGEILKNYKKLSYVPQKNYIDKTFPISVEEFIKIFNTKTSDTQIKSYLEKFDCLYLFDKKIWNLSGWEFQKIIIISSLISNPDLLLLDEPTAWIDIVWEQNFYKLIKEVKQNFNDLSIIIVSHNIKLVYKNSDKVICLHENNFCCHWTPLEMKQNKISEALFWEYTALYKHSPHNKNTHNK